MGKYKHFNAVTFRLGNKYTLSLGALWWKLSCTISFNQRCSASAFQRLTYRHLVSINYVQRYAAHQAKKESSKVCTSALSSSENSYDDRTGL